MSLIKFKVNKWSARPEAIEYSRETAHYYVRPSGGRDAKFSRYYAYFDTEAEALQHIAERQQAEQAAKRLKQIEAAAPDLLAALEDAVLKLRSGLILLKYDDESIEKQTDKARVAIAKATGGKL